MCVRAQRLARTLADLPEIAVRLFVNATQPGAEPLRASVRTLELKVTSQESP
jgi:hypothetical protein